MPDMHRPAAKVPAGMSALSYAASAAALSSISAASSIRAQFCTATRISSLRMMPLVL